MRRSSDNLLKPALSVASLLVAFVLTAGVHALWTGRSFLSDPREVQGGARHWMSDADRIAAGASLGGPFAVSQDPHVAFSLKPRLASRFATTWIETDSLGLRLEIDRLPGLPGLYPLELQVEVNGHSAGTLEVLEPPPASPRATYHLDLPAEVAGDLYFDVLLLASGWIQDDYQGVSRLHAFGFAALELE